MYCVWSLVVFYRGPESASFSWKKKLLKASKANYFLKAAFKIEIEIKSYFLKHEIWEIIFFSALRNSFETAVHLKT